MSRTNQGTLLTVSPAIGSYKDTVGMTIDSGYTGVSGDVNAATLVDYWRDTGVTGISGSNFKNMTDSNVIGGVSYK